jgi:AsmA protein
VKLLKRLFLILLVLVVIAVATPFIAIQLLDPDDIKNEIATHISAATGRQTTIEGEVKLTAYPWLGAQLGTVTLGHSSAFAKQAGASAFFARFKGAAVRVQLMPLLQREVRMDTVTINGLELYLARAADGTFNWADLAGNAHSSDAAGGTKPLAALALGGVQLNDGAVHWYDATTKQSARATAINLATGPIDLAKAKIDITADLKVVADAPSIAGAIKLNTSLSYVEAEQRLLANALALEFEAAGDAVGGEVKTKLSGDAQFKIDTGVLTLSGLRVDSADLDIAGNSAILAGTSNTLTVDTKQSSVIADGLTANVSALALASGINGKLELSGDVNVNAQSARVNKLSSSGTLTGGAIKQGKLPFKLNGSAVFNGLKQTLVLPGMQLLMSDFNVDQNTGTLDIRGDVAIALKALQLRVPNLRVNGNLGGRAVRGGSATIALTTSLNTSIKSGVTTVSQVKLALTKLKTMGVSGAVNIAGNATANTRTQAFSVKGLSIEPNLLGASLPEGRLAGRATVNAVADLRAQTVKVTSFKSNFAGLKTNGSVTVGGLGGAPSVSGAIVIAPFSPRTLLTAFKQAIPNTADSKVLRRASLKAKFSGTLKRVKLNPFTLKLDDTTVTGSASITNLNNPAYVFDLRVNGIDLSRYLPPSAKNKAASPGAAATAAATLPLQTLRGFNANGSLRIGSLRLANLRITNAAVKVVAKGGNIRLAPVSARLYKGKYAGNIRLDARGKAAKLSLNEQLTGVDIGALLTDLKGKAAVTGLTNVTAKLTTSGNNGDQLMRALNGSAAFRIEQGTIRQIDMVRTICNLVEGGQGGETRFDAMTGTAKVVNGVIENDKLSVSSPLLRIGAAGVVDLPRDSLDYRGNVALVGTCKGQGGRVRGKLNGLDIPIRITGSIANPKPRLDTSKLIESVARREIERKSERITQKIQEKVGEQAGKALGETARKLSGGLLKGLLGN